MYLISKTDQSYSVLGRATGIEFNSLHFVRMGTGRMTGMFISQISDFCSQKSFDLKQKPRTPVFFSFVNLKLR